MLSETQVRNAKASDRPRKIFDNMPRFREIYDVKQLRDVSEYLIRKVEAAI
jgi:hypothetical protein